jgi:hypothetical protein
MGKMDDEIREALKRAKHLEELDKRLLTIEELEKSDEEFRGLVKKLRKLINNKRQKYKH